MPTRRVSSCPGRWAAVLAPALVGLVALALVAGCDRASYLCAGPCVRLDTCGVPLTVPQVDGPLDCHEACPRLIEAVQERCRPLAERYVACMGEASCDDLQALAQGPGVVLRCIEPLLEEDPERTLGCVGELGTLSPGAFAPVEGP